MWRSSTMTVGVPVGTSKGPFAAGSGSGCTRTSLLGTAGSSPFTFASSLVSSATPVPLLSPPEVPEAEAECEHCPEYASRPHHRRGSVPVDEDVAHPLDVGRRRVEVHGVGDPLRQPRDPDHLALDGE